MYNKEKRTIQTKNLLLRELTFDDAENVARLCNNYNISKYTLNIPYPYSLEDAKEWIGICKKNFDNDKIYTFAITNLNTKEFYGSIGLSYDKKHENGELGYWIGEEYWNKGFASEASQGVIDFAFNYLNYNKIYANYIEPNHNSGNVMKKIGMKKEGELLSHFKVEEDFLTSICYGINKNEYEKLQK